MIAIPSKESAATTAQILMMISPPKRSAKEPEAIETTEAAAKKLPTKRPSPETLKCRLSRTWTASAPVRKTGSVVEVAEVIETATL